MAMTIQEALKQAAKVLSSQGGKARAKKLSAARRSEIAKKASQTRWGKDRDAKK